MVRRCSPRWYLVSEEDKDVLYELVSTSREAQYEKFDEQPAYLIKFEEIESVKPVASVPPNDLA
jgi:hypothetical protein